MAQQTEGMITRDVLPYGEDNSRAGAWKLRTRLDFYTAPVTAEVARAHLELHAPHGVIVISRRGPRGGWAYLRYVRKTEAMPRHMKDRTLHIAKEHYEIYRGEIGHMESATFVASQNLPIDPAGPAPNTVDAVALIDTYRQSKAGQMLTALWTDELTQLK